MKTLSLKEKGLIGGLTLSALVIGVSIATASFAPIGFTVIIAMAVCLAL